MYLFLGGDALGLGVELLPLRHEHQFAGLRVLLQGLTVELAAAAFGAEDEVVLTLGRKRLLELLLADQLLFMRNDLLLLFFLYFGLDGLFYLLGLLLLGRRVLLLDLLFGGFLGD
jgi:hypothetical protein